MNHIIKIEITSNFQREEAQHLDPIAAARMLQALAGITEDDRKREFFEGVGAYLTKAWSHGEHLRMVAAITRDADDLRLHMRKMAQGLMEGVTIGPSDRVLNA